MGKQNKRKSEAGTVASPKKIKTEPKSPKAVETPKKVKIEAKSPKSPKNKPLKTPIKLKAPKNKPLKTPIKHKAPKNPTEGNATQTPKIQKKTKVQKKKEKAAVSVQKKVHLIPDELTTKLTRRQRKRVFLKLKVEFQKIGKEDLSEIDMKDPQVKEIIDKFLSEKLTETVKMNPHTKKTAVEKKAIKKEPNSPAKKVKKEKPEGNEVTKKVKVQKIQPVKNQKKAKAKQKKAANE